MASSIINSSCDSDQRASQAPKAVSEPFLMMLDLMSETEPCVPSCGADSQGTQPHFTTTLVTSR